MPRNTARQINRATVVKCAISATFCHPQLFEITDTKDEIPVLVQHSCRNAKVVEAFCDPGCRLSTYTNRCTRRLGLSPANEVGADIKIPIGLAASQCPTSRDFVPWRFSAAGRRSAWAGVYRAISAPLVAAALDPGRDT